MMLRRHLDGAVVALAAAILLLPATVTAQNVSTSFSTADLAGRWFVSQVTTPTTSFTRDDIRAYSGNLVFDATGAIAPSSSGDPNNPDNVLDDREAFFAVNGSLTVSPEGLVRGTLDLTFLSWLDNERSGRGEDRRLVVREARLLVNRHTIVGAAAVEPAAGGTLDTGLFTFVRLTAQAFDIDADLPGDWHYHEITPTNQSRSGNADWTRGTITFHEREDGQNQSCTEADLFFSDGSERQRRDEGLRSFG